MNKQLQSFSLGSSYLADLLPGFVGNEGWHCTYADILSNLFLEIDIDFVETDMAEFWIIRVRLENR